METALDTRLDDPIIACGCGRLITDEVAASEAHVHHPMASFKIQDFRPGMGFVEVVESLQLRPIDTSLRVMAELAAWYRIDRQLPMRLRVAFAYNPSDRGFNPGCDHVIVEDDLRAARLVRLAGDALCRPRVRFFALCDKPTPAYPTCERCVAAARRLIPA